MIFLRFLSKTCFFHLKKGSALKAMLGNRRVAQWLVSVVLVLNSDGYILFCVDSRKVNNAVSKFDAYPMPQVDKIS
jgi:hypothetical protein